MAEKENYISGWLSEDKGSIEMIKGVKKGAGFEARIIHEGVTSDLEIEVQKGKDGVWETNGFKIGYDRAAPGALDKEKEMLELACKRYVVMAHTLSADELSWRVKEAAAELPGYVIAQSEKERFVDLGGVKCNLRAGGGDSQGFLIAHVIKDGWSLVKTGRYKNFAAALEAMGGIEKMRFKSGEALEAFIDKEFGIEGRNIKSAGKRAPAKTGRMDVMPYRWKKDEAGAAVMEGEIGGISARLSEMKSPGGGISGDIFKIEYVKGNVKVTDYIPAFELKEAAAFAQNVMAACAYVKKWEVDKRVISEAHTQGKLAQLDGVTFDMSRNLELKARMELSGALEKKGHTFTPVKEGPLACYMYETRGAGEKHFGHDLQRGAAVLADMDIGKPNELFEKGSLGMGENEKFTLDKKTFASGKDKKEYAAGGKQNAGLIKSSERWMFKRNFNEREAAAFESQFRAFSEANSKAAREAAREAAPEKTAVKKKSGASR